MAGPDYSVWRRAGYISAGDASRALGVPASSIHRWMNRGRLAFQLQGRRHFVKRAELIDFVRKTFTDPVVADAVVERVRAAAKKRAT